MRITALIFMLAAIPAAFATPVVSVQPGPGLTAAIEISGVTDLYAFQFDLSFLPQVLAATTITEGGFLPAAGSTFFVHGAINNTIGTISSTADTVLGSIGGVSGSGVLANVGFSPAGQGVSPLALLNVQLLDSRLSPIVFTATDGRISQITPEPGSFALFFFGLFALTLAVRRY
ncbi:MAG TPA: cohesin domain-containing protein [Bryobacteraceae bacterium]|nr:cohesin domain-containing protein [Bryobacteraceae bacterium]